MRKLILVGLLPALSIPMLAHAQPPGGDASQNITVTGVPLPDLRARLAACLARNCPPDEDIDATMALAEALFVAGDYRDARTALRGSLGRNRDEAARYPEPVSDLYRANARVARHLGMDDDAHHSTRQILRALQAGLAVEDHRHFTARLEIAQSMFAFGQYDLAIRGLRDLVERARAAGRDDVVAMAELRLLWVSYVQTPHGGARDRLVEMSRSPDPYRSHGAKRLLIRIYSEYGDTQRADALIAELGRHSQRRQLLYSPPYELTERDNSGRSADRQEQALQGGGSLLIANISDRVVANFEDVHIDVGFWVRADGRVEDVEIVRRSSGASWAPPLLQSISGRRYAPADRATYRLERYTLTSGIERRVTGTHIPYRTARARVEYYDLGETVAPTPAPADGPAARQDNIH
ncbi:MAG TPA: hypothetical protein VEX35_12705 [Allosphingosinicella sp.]|nr:hypothetical protein [Allosphingosinicella sp.]